MSTAPSRLFLPRLFLTALGVILVGYAFMSRAFAYVGVPPVYAGEIVLAVGLVAVLTGFPVCLLRAPTVWLIALFCAWGAVRTLPYIGTYGINALRDAVLWGYGLFAVLVAAALLRTGLIWRGIDRYATWVPWFLVWALPYFVVTRSIENETLSSLFVWKGGDMQVHLAGIAALAALGLAPSVRRSVGTSIALACLWFAAFAVATSISRGGFAACVAAMLTLVALQPVEMGRRLVPAARRLLVPLATVVVLLVATGGVLGISKPGDERSVSLSQIGENVNSILHPGASPENLGGTVDWRMDWWKTIDDYTLRGPYFWTGKGFGVNLADDDGYQVEEDNSLRSPHNGHLNVLARTGVPGLVVWFLVLASFAGTMVVGYFRARRAQLERLAAAHAWILAYWVACIVNAAFDVYLEGPQGGIWFWSLMGAGLAVSAMARDAISVRPRVYRRTFTTALAS